MGIIKWNEIEFNNKIITSTFRRRTHFFQIKCNKSQISPCRSSICPRVTKARAHSRRESPPNSDQLREVQHLVLSWGRQWLYTQPTICIRHKARRGLSSPMLMMLRHTKSSDGAHASRDSSALEKKHRDSRCPQ